MGYSQEADQTILRKKALTLVMVRRMNMSMRPVHRIKHVVDISQTLNANTQINLDIIEAKDAPVLANATEVETGSKVNAIYLKFEVASNEAIDLGAIPNFYLIVVKSPGGSINIPVPNAVGVSDNKRFVIHQEMVMIENKGQGSNVRVVFNGVIVIPRGYRRFGPNDVLSIGIKCPALATASCLQCHYKEFR